MPRNPEYQEFLDFVYGKRQDPLAKDLETTSSEQEVGWWKQYQVRRAIRKAGRGEATPTDLIFLARKKIYFRSTPKEYLPKKITKRK